MTPTAGLLTLHGMGGEKRGYAQPLLDALRDRLDADWPRIAVETVYYQEAIQGRQEEIFARMQLHVDWESLRRFFLYSFSDAATLEHRAAEPDSPYHEAQRTIRDALDGTFTYTGSAIIRTTVILGCGLVPFAFSSYLSIRFLGTYLVFVLSCAVLADLLLLPALVLLFDKEKDDGEDP